MAREDYNIDAPIYPTWQVNWRICSPPEIWRNTCFNHFRCNFYASESVGKISSYLIHIHGVDWTGKLEKTEKNPGILFRTGNFFILLQNILFSLSYLPFTPFGFMRIERQVPRQEIFITCCESLQKYNFVQYLTLQSVIENKFVTCK